MSHPAPTSRYPFQIHKRWATDTKPTVLASPEHIPLQAMSFAVLPKPRDRDLMVWEISVSDDPGISQRHMRNTPVLVPRNASVALTD